MYWRAAAAAAATTIKDYDDNDDAYDAHRNQNRPVDLDEIKQIYYSTSHNERVPCSSLPEVNLEAWIERRAPRQCSPSRGDTLARRPPGA